MHRRAAVGGRDASPLSEEGTSSVAQPAPNILQRWLHGNRSSSSRRLLEENSKHISSGEGGLEMSRRKVGIDEEK